MLGLFNSIHRDLCENIPVDQAAALHKIEDFLKQAEDKVEDHEVVFMAWACKFRLAGRISIYERARGDCPHVGELDKLMTEDELGFWLMQEVQRGCENGFDLFFTDSKVCKFGSQAVQAFRRIGAVQHAELFADVLTLYGDGPTGDQGDVLDAFEKLGEEVESRLEEIEDEMFALRLWSLYGFEWDWKRQS